MNVSIEDIANATEKLAGAYAASAEAMAANAAVVDAWNHDWARWQMEFCATASDEEIAEADRLFGTSALTELRVKGEKP